MKLLSTIKSVAIIVLALAFFITATSAATAGPLKIFSKAKDNYTVKVGGVEVKSKEKKKEIDRMYADLDDVDDDASTEPQGWWKRNWAWALLIVIVAGVVASTMKNDDDGPDSHPLKVK